MASERRRLIIPDSHGSGIDPDAATAFLEDAKRLNPHELVFLGDHVDVGGNWGEHPTLNQNELEYSYFVDLDAANDFLDAVQEACPNVEEADYLQGNHEHHIERWASRHLAKADVSSFIDDFAPHARLNLEERGIKHWNRNECHQGLSIPNTIVKCVNGVSVYFTHGTASPRSAAQHYLGKFGDNVVFGHTHRSQSYVTKTVATHAIGAWCPGTLAKLQPYYMHTNLSEHTHGYAIQFVQPSGRFLHVNVPIVNGVSMLPEALSFRNRRNR